MRFFKKKSFFKLLFIVVAYLALEQLIEKQTRGFYLQKILEHDLPTREEWQVAPLSAFEQHELMQTLQQPFTFLGAGSECFAFLSADGKKVIKFFKLDSLRPVYLMRGVFFEDYSKWAETLNPLNPRIADLPLWLQKTIKRIRGIRAFRICRTFNSLKTSYTHLKEETALLYLHLNPTDTLHTSLTLYDPNGIAHTVDLDTTRFYVQERATPLIEHFLHLKEKNDLSGAHKSIDSLFDLIIQRCCKGFQDRDPYIKNFGFIQERAVEIDTGSFTPCLAMKKAHNYKQELFFITLELREWAERNYPVILPYLLKRLSQEISQEQEYTLARE